MITYQPIIDKVNAMAWRIQSYELERQARKVQTWINSTHRGGPTYTYPARWELEDFLKSILKELKDAQMMDVWSAVAGEYTKDQHITDLQTRNTDLVEDNRALKAKLENVASILTVTLHKMSY
jgi:uncharacterized protein YhaN